MGTYLGLAGTFPPTVRTYFNNGKSFVSSVIFGNGDIVPLDFPHFGLQRDRETEKRRYIGPTSRVILLKKEMIPLTGPRSLPEGLKSR